MGEVKNEALITNDAVVLGLLLIILALVFKTSSLKTPFWQKFYTFIPSVLLCYFIPALFNSFGIIDGDKSRLYFVASRYLLPASLVLLTLSIDLPAIMRLGKKAIAMFLTGTAGIVIGGPLAIMIVAMFSPETVGGSGPEEVWRGLATIAGTWIGGGANQAAMYEVFGASPDLFSKMIAVDVLIANLWMAFLLYGASVSDKLDNYFKADASAINEVKTRIEKYQLSVAKIPSLSDTMVILGLGFGSMGVSHLLGNHIAPYLDANFPALRKYSLTSDFFWIVVLSTTIGLILSFTRFKKYEGAGASRLGSVLIYILVATIGMKMDITAVLESPGLFLVGFIWISIHVTLLFIVAKLIRAPFFFIAVGSQANIGGAASAPIVASAFHPALATVGVLLAVFGYALGTYMAYLCGLLMQFVSG